jgi:hypothetical protein
LLRCEVGRERERQYWAAVVPRAGRTT